jgi:LuxR family maltose regulon positive regulatory protein
VEVARYLVPLSTFFAYSVLLKLGPISRRVWRMNVSWLLKAKTLPPKQLVSVHPRTTLVEPLMLARQHRVTVLEAPPGFGKTTVLALWRMRLLSESVRVAWLTLDSDDIGPLLPSYIAYAMSEAGVDMASTGLLDRRRSAASNGTQAVTTLLNSIGAFGNPVCLMLDDAEKLTDQETQNLLGMITRYAPDNLHVAIAFRANPGIALSNLFVKGLVHQIDATGLRFTTAEAAEYLSGILPVGDLRTALARADGWPVALQLLRSLAEQAPSSKNFLTGIVRGGQLAASYFTEQLFCRLTSRQQEFFLDVILLDDPSISLADCVRDADDSEQILKELEYMAALITPLEGASEIFRIHPMLREHFMALTHRNIMRVKTVYRRAAIWFADHGQLLTALRNAIAAGDPNLAGILIERAGAASIYIRHGMDEVVAADRLVDDSMIEQFPRLGLMRCIRLIKEAKLREARNLYDHISTATNGFTNDRDGGDLAALQRDNMFIHTQLVIYGCMAFSEDHYNAIERSAQDPSSDHTVLAHHMTVLCVTNLRNGRLDLAERYGREALEHCLAFDSVFGANFIAFHQGAIAMARGDSARAVTQYEKGRRASRRHFPHDSGLRLVGDVFTAELDLERNAVANVRRRVTRFMDQLHKAEAWYDVYAAAYSSVTEVYLLEQGVDDALAFIDHAELHVQHQGLSNLYPFLEALRVGALSLAGESERALEAAKRSRVFLEGNGLTISHGVPWREVEASATAWVRLMLLLHRYEEAKATALTALNYAQASGIARMALRLKVLLALIAEKSGDAKGAATQMANVIALVARTGYSRAVLREGTALLPAINRATLETDSLRQQADNLLMLLREEPPSDHRTNLFSPRELEVLHQLNRGLQDKIIARRLGVTEHAVRFHLKNIYAKTGAQGRLDAVVKARALGVVA